MSKQVRSVTFDVCNLDKTFRVASKAETRGASEVLSHMLGRKLEQSTDSSARFLVGKFSSPPANLAGLSLSSFNDHRPLILDPDTIWLTIERGLADHIKSNAEELRSKFVNFSGKQTIEVRRDHFIRGQKNDWEGCFDEFSEKIGDYIGPKKDLIVSDFSTTTKLASVSSEIVLMDAMSEYFNYMVSTCCGIPSVTLEGEVEDWEKIRDRINAFHEFDLGWWVDAMIPALDEFIAASSGNANVDFWKNWYNENGGGSGEPDITGNMLRFFPYVGREEVFRSPYFTGKGRVFQSSIPFGYSTVPFLWSYYDQMYPMQFCGGIIGVVQDDNGGVRAGFGWSVYDDKVSLKNFPIEKLQKGMPLEHKSGRAGFLTKAEAFEYGDGSLSLSDIYVIWDDGKEEHFSSWKAQELFVNKVFTEEPEKQARLGGSEEGDKK